MSRPALRDRASLAAQVTLLARSGVKSETEFERGATAALQWLLDGGPGPATGERNVCSTAPRSIVRELAAAEAAIYESRLDQQDYPRGIVHALMWAQYVTSTAPREPNS